MSNRFLIQSFLRPALRAERISGGLAADELHGEDLDIFAVAKAGYHVHDGVRRVVANGAEVLPHGGEGLIAEVGDGDVVKTGHAHAARDSQPVFPQRVYGAGGQPIRLAAEGVEVCALPYKPLCGGIGGLIADGSWLDDQPGVGLGAELSQGALVAAQAFMT